MFKKLAVRPQLAPALSEMMTTLGVHFVEPEELIYIGCDPVRQGCYGFWDPILDIISVKFGTSVPTITGENGNNFLMHELVHWTGHPTRLNRSFIAKILEARTMAVALTGEFDTEEMTAQIGMTKLARALGLPYSDISVANYWGFHRAANLDKAETDAEAAVSYLLERAFGRISKAA